MEPNYQDILKKLAEAKVQFLVAGGIAMNIHGLSRSTFDLDLIIFLKRDNVLKFIEVMSQLGYRPRVPVDPKQFADESIRKRWVKEKNMVVFSFYHEENLMNLVDVFVEHPRDFEEMYASGKESQFFGASLRAVGIQDMLAMKEKAARPKDEMDLRFLRSLDRKQKD